MAGVTSLNVRVKFWRDDGLSGPAIMVCANALVSESKHSKNCYLLFFPFYSVILLLFFFQLSKAMNREKRNSFKWETQDKGDRKKTAE